MLTTGQFSKICQVSVKTLYYYDRIGLLVPLRVDPATGYRYYSREQVDRMLLIGRLKKYGFSLVEVAGLLDCADERVLFSRLKNQKEKLTEQRRKTELIISELSDHLQNFERTGNIMGYQKRYNICTVRTPDRAVTASRQMMGVKDFGTYFTSLYQRMAEEGLTPDGIRGAVYYDEEFNHECSDIELIVGVKETERADKIMKSSFCASTVHKGAYSSLSDAYGALVVWIEENGYAWDGAPYEIYTKTQFDGLEPKDWETEIYFPVKEKGNNE